MYKLEQNNELAKIFTGIIHMSEKHNAIYS